MTERWTAKVLTLFPDMFPGPLGFSLAGKALDKGLWALETTDIRKFASDKHSTVDDAPFGGGPGMVMRAWKKLTSRISARIAAGCAPLFLSAESMLECRMLSNAVCTSCDVTTKGRPHRCAYCMAYSKTQVISIVHFPGLNPCVCTADFFSWLR